MLKPGLSSLYIVFHSVLSWSYVTLRLLLVPLHNCQSVSLSLDGTACQPEYMDQCGHSDLFLSGFGFWVTHSFCQLQPLQQQL